MKNKTIALISGSLSDFEACIFDKYKEIKGEKSVVRLSYGLFKIETKDTSTEYVHITHPEHCAGAIFDSYEVIPTDHLLSAIIREVKRRTKPNPA